MKGVTGSPGRSPAAGDKPPAWPQELLGRGLPQGAGGSSPPGNGVWGCHLHQGHKKDSQISPFFLWLCFFVVVIVVLFICF